MARMRTIHSLHLHEQVLLLALRNDKGTVAGGVMYQQAAGGAILAELLLEGRLKTETEGRSTYAVAVNRTSMGDSILDECLRRVSEASRRAKLQTWVQRFGAVKQLKHRAAAPIMHASEPPALMRILAITHCGAVPPKITALTWAGMMKPSQKKPAIPKACHSEGSDTWNRPSTAAVSSPIRN
jgi:hypothetical protein